MSHIQSHTLTFFKNIPDPDNADNIEHVEIGKYECGPVPPWVPPQGSFFRFRDPYPPGRPHDHREVAGTVSDVVTVFYGTSVTIEVYITPST